MLVIKEQPSMRRMNNAINEMAEFTKKNKKTVFTQQMRLLATDLAYVTIPKGKNPGDEKENQLKILSDIRKVYLSPKRVVWRMQRRDKEAAKHFVALLKQGGRAKKKIQDLLDKHLKESNVTLGTFDGGKLHHEQKGVYKPSRTMLVLNQNKVESYAKKIGKLVGFAKGAYATAAKQLGGARDIPSFAKRQKSPGKGYVAGSDDNLSVVMENHVRYAASALKRIDESVALKHRTKMIYKVMKDTQDRRLKKIMERNK